MSFASSPLGGCWLAARCGMGHTSVLIVRVVMSRDPRACCEGKVCRVGEGLVQVPFAMDAAVISHTIPGELVADV